MSLNNIPTEIVSCKIYKNGVLKCEINPIVITELNIYHSLNFPCIQGDITIQDYDGIQNEYEIFAGDEIVISIKVGNSVKDFKYVIYSLKDVIVREYESFYMLTLNFCSKWIIDALVRQFSYPFNDKRIDEIVEFLLIQCNGDIGEIEQSKIKFNNFVTPKWNIIKIIRYLQEFCMSSDDKAGYILYTDEDDKIHFKSLKKIREEAILCDNDLYINVENVVYEGRVHQYTIENSFDLIKFLNQGCFHTVVFDYDYDKQKVVLKDFKYNEIERLNLGSHIPINNKYLDDKYTHFKHVPYYLKSDEMQKEDKISQFLEGYLKNHYTMLLSDIIKVDVLANFSLERKIGNLIRVHIPNIAKSKQQNILIDDTIFSGIYMIQSCRWIFTQHNALQVLTLISDGYKEGYSDALTWF